MNKSYLSALSYCCFALSVFFLFFLAINPDHFTNLYYDGLVLTCICLGAFFSISSLDKKITTTPVMWIHLKPVLSGLGVLLLFFGSRCLLSLWQGHPFKDNCSIVGPWVYQFDCYFNTSSSGNYSMRVFPSHVFAALIFLVGWFYGWFRAHKQTMFFNIAATFLLAYCIVDLLYSSSFTSEFAAWMWSIKEQPLSPRSSGPFSNYGWAWPFLGIPLSVFFWSIFHQNPTNKSFSKFVLYLLGLGILLSITIRNGQRGLELCWIGLFIVGIVTRFFRHQAFSKGFVFFPLLVFIVPLNFYNPLLNYLGWPSVLKNQFSASMERLQIWKFGWSKFWEAPFWGHGSATWYQLSEASYLKTGSPDVYESAHNFFIQILVEHGVIGFLLWAIAIWLLSGGPRKLGFTRTTHNHFLLFFLAVPCLIALMVQEIDLIRTTYYSWAFVGGILLGCFAKQRVVTVSQEVSTQYVKKVFFAVGAFGFLCFLVGTFFFAHGVYGFDFPNEKGGVITRWMKPKVSFQNFTTKRFLPFVSWPDEILRFKLLVQSKFEMKVLENPNSAKLVKDDAAQDVLYLEFHRKNYDRIILQCNDSYLIDTRKVSGQIVYPPR